MRLHYFVTHNFTRYTRGEVDNFYTTLLNIHYSKLCAILTEIFKVVTKNNYW